MWPPPRKIASDGHRLARAAGEQVSSRRSMTSLPSVERRPGVTRSLVGQKAVMAVTGVILFLFVVAHLLGNLKIFEGPEAFNAYAEGLRTVGAPFFGRGWLLWIARIVLIVAVLAHIWAAIATTRASWRARPVGYRRLEPVETTYAARTMRWGGVLIFLYVIYHLLDFTFGRVNPGFVPGDVYHNVMASLRVWPVAAAYIAAMVVLGLPLYHGPWSALQTLGLNRPPAGPWRAGAAGALDRGAGRDQRRQELPERRRLGVPTVLRHDQGRRLPRARGQRVSAGRGQRQHHRPVHGPGCPVRARVRRLAGESLLRRGPGRAHLLRARPDRPATAARRLSGVVAADRHRHRPDATARPGARPGGDRRPGARHHRARSGDGCRERACRRRGGARDRRLLERLLPVDQREGLQRHRHLARVQARRHVREPVLYPDPPDLHPADRTAPVQADADERVAPQRRSHLGPQQEGRYAAAASDSGGGAGLLSRAAVPELREPRAAGHRVEARQGSVRRGARCGAGGGRPRRVLGLPRRHRAPRPSGDRRALRQPVRDVPAHHGGGPVPGADADLPRPALHDGRPVGGLQPDDHRRRPVRHRRGELLRPRRQPVGSERAHARARGRLFHPAVHHRRLPRPGEARQGRSRASGVPPDPG